MRSFLAYVRAGAGFGLGLILVMGLTALLAQTYSTFTSGQVVSAAKINENFTLLRSELTNAQDRLTTPLPLSQSSGIASQNFNTVGTTFTDMPGMSVSVTTGGSPVWLALVPLGTTASSIKIEGNAAGNGCAAQLAFVRGTTTVAVFYLQISHTFTADSVSNHYMPSSIWTIDSPGAGTHAYKVQIRDATGGNCRDITFSNVKFVAMRFNESP